MKPLLSLLFLALAVHLHAGGPGAEMKDALIESVELSPLGCVVFVTGPIDVVTQGGMVRLQAVKARIHVPGGHPIHAFSGGGKAMYDKRLKAAVGQKNLIQMWGPILTIESGIVVDIVAGHVPFLEPQQNEAAFDVDRLFKEFLKK